MALPAMTNDVIFKIVFGSQKNERVLRALLNALLDLSGPDRIDGVEILNPYIDKEHMADRGVILDIKARDQADRLYNIEVQVAADPDYVKRSLYNSSAANYANIRKLITPI